jgi:tetratricopeptide (TPR) repeat protein
LNPERRRLLAGGLIVLAALAAYHNSFSGPFVFDDLASITDNPTIRHLGSAWSPPVDSTAGGRPLLNLTFAINYALGGLNVWGYHVFNLLVHTLAGLTLFGIVRRTLASRLATRGSEISNLRFEISADATPVAAAVAVLWVVHPLQTEAVTYISQRAESLMGLFYLLTLYCFVRGVEGAQTSNAERRTPNAESPTTNYELPTTERRRLSGYSSSLWILASVGACLLGTMTKEIIVTAPVMVLLYDRTFVAGSFREAWRLRWRYYLGLACTWLLLARLMIGTGLDQRAVGFDQGVSWWSYGLTSCRSVVLYLKMSVWPHPLVFDYGTHVVSHAMDVIPYALVLALLLLAALIALRYRPVIGFTGAWFFVILAPASSIIPVAGQPMAEHRVYLSLAAVVLLFLLVLYRLIGRHSLMLCAVVAVGLGCATVQRNQDYESELAIWSDTAAKCPDNERAHSNLGNLLLNVPGRLPEAIVHYEAVVRSNPGSAEMHFILGNALLKMPGRVPDAIAAYEAALRIKPGYAEAHKNLGTALLKMPGRATDAMAQYEAALRIKPDYAEAHYDLGNALRDVPGRLPDAIAQYEAALRINPVSVETHVNLGSALLRLPGRTPDAIAQFQAALQIDPDLVEAHNDLGNALSTLPGRLPEAIDQYEAALRLNPNSVSAHYNLGMALLKMPGRQPDAIDQFKAALRLKPDLKPAQDMLEQQAR